MNVSIVSLFIVSMFVVTTAFLPQKACTGCYVSHNKHKHSHLFQSNDDNDGHVSTEAERLLAKARALRAEIAKEEDAGDAKQKQVTAVVSPWRIDNEDVGDDYRFYVDIGREEGTWMDPRWGASGQRIEFSLDVRFMKTVANASMSELMVKDNFGGKSSPVYDLQSASFARLRSGFDKMKCSGGAYRIDSQGSSSSTVRLYVMVDGVNDSSYGDVSIPQGCLYFSIPCFGGTTGQLSGREAPVTVRQIGWHTGFRRQESRMVGVFRAVKTNEAEKKDGF